MKRLLSAALLLLLGACSQLQFFDAIVPKDGGGRKVATGIPYGGGERRKLDVYAPTRRADPALKPVVVYFYGGNWNSGDRTGYTFLGRALAAHGLVTVVPDYRVFPEVRYPGFLEDAAQAVRWVRANAVRYGGDPDRILLMGHSAGGHIAAMLAVDDRWLGPDRKAVRGLIGLAGAYDFLPFEVESSQAAFGQWPRPEETQPVTWAGAGDPPALLIVGEKDQTVRPRNSESLAAKLQAAGVPVELKRYANLAHPGVVTSIARPLRYRAPVLAEITAFADRVTRDQASQTRRP